MLGSISPVGEASRGQRWWLTATAYALASTAAGALLGLAVGGLGAVLLAGVPTAPRLAVLGVAALVGAATDAGVGDGRLPSLHRQVDERWLDAYRGWVYGAGFGAQLGAAVATIVPSAATYAALVAVALTGSWQAGLAVGAVFGGARALPLLLMATVRTAARLHAVTRRIAHAGPAAHGVAIGCQCAVACAALLPVVP